MKCSLVLIVIFPSVLQAQQIILQPTPPVNHELNHEEAVSAAIDNRLKSVQTYWEIYDLYRARHEEKINAIKLARAKYLQKHELTSFTENEFDSSSGTIYWLATFKQPCYKKYVDTINKLMVRRSYSGGLSIYEYEEYREASRGLRILLADHRKYYPEQVVSEMIRFVLKIDREVAKI